jgi:hypothetical protein
VTLTGPWLAVTLLTLRLAAPASAPQSVPTPSVINSKPAAPMQAANDLSFIALPHAVNATLGGPADPAADPPFW